MFKYSKCRMLENSNIRNIDRSVVQKTSYSKTRGFRNTRKLEYAKGRRYLNIRTFQNLYFITFMLPEIDVEVLIPMSSHFDLLNTHGASFWRLSSYVFVNYAQRLSERRCPSNYFTSCFFLLRKMCFS